MAMLTRQPSNDLESGKVRRIGDRYRRLLIRPNMDDQEIAAIRKHVILLARTVCEHVWGKRFY